ncbi:polysaccharide deacetylase family protein [Rufibacter latericius]|uniref:NodB homology domain-containing protein n=1 Tax=Rufibacter latericius TaxID=2487040 RepID=A0A3M9MH86_9BACT|nr:polysaccharide deacetylase family protein [Rufibacter latericius]RNI24545.1 hypothetical protein EFB08_16665 [Rufibacter latericius]
MRARFHHIYQKLFTNRAAVLMYHRIADPASDIWDIAVSPSNFEQQLAYLQKKCHVIPLSEMAERVATRKIKRNSVAITFDDGYVDNFTVAKPLLEKYNLPATFFISSGNIGQETPFWWDELEQLILFTEQLPSSFQGLDSLETVDLREETYLTAEIRLKHTSWKACDEAPPTKRAQLFYSLWQHLKPLSYQAQQEVLQRIRDWAAPTGETLPELKSMSLNQLQELGQSALIEIGAHTVSHPALAFHDSGYQTREMTENQTFLRETTGQPVNLMAYPFGNYNADTLASVARLKFKAAFTTEEKSIDKHAHPFRLGRYQVKNVPAPAFSATLRSW